MREDFKTLIRKFCMESSVLGLKYFYLYPDPLSRLFWTLSLMLTLFMSYILTFYLYNRFADMPTRISIENQYAPIQNISFPAIAICSPNQITISSMTYFAKTLVESNITMNLKNILPRLLGFYELFGDSKPDDLIKLQNVISANRYSALDVMGMMPQSCDNFLKLCYLRNKRYSNCKGLFKPILTKRGMCCIFNSIYHYNNKRNERMSDFVPYKAVRGGLVETLTVVTDYEPENALWGTILIAGAVRIMFMDASEFPADDESTLVYPYSESFHAIHATHTYCSEDVTALPSSSRQCYFEDEHRLPYFTKYHNSDCDLTCYVSAIEHHCHCTMIYVPYIRPNRACNVTSIDCIVKTRLEMNKWQRTESCNCPRDCESTRYRVEVSMGNLLGLPALVHNKYSDIQFKKSTSILHFFFRNSVHTKQKQETVMSLITLSSNLGGVFGLCLGCSMISILEVIFYVYSAVRNMIREYLQNICKSKVASADYNKRPKKVLTTSKY